MKKRILAWALLICMLATLLPVSAFAEGELADEPTELAGDGIPTEDPADPAGEEPAPPADTEDDPAEPVGADAPGDPEATDEPTDPVILSGSEGSQDEPVGADAPDVPEDTADIPEEPAGEELAPAADTEEAPAESVRVLFVCAPAELTLTVYTLDEYNEKQIIEPEEDGSYLLMPGSYFYDAACEDFTPVEKEELRVEAAVEPLRVELYLAPAEPAGDGVLDVPHDAEDDAFVDPFHDAETDALPAADDVQGTVASGTCGDNLTWTLDDSGTLTISGTGAMTDYSYSSSAPWDSKRSSIKRATISSGVTSIGRYAFKNCRSLTSITISEGVTSIGSYAFSNCSSLTSITIPESVTSIGDDTFSNCSSLTSITIPESVTSIGNNAFSGCSKLTRITIPESLTHIGGYVFSGCTRLTEIQVAEGNPVYSSLAGILFNKAQTELTRFPVGRGGEYCVPEGVTSIGSEAFDGCRSLTSIAIPEGVTSIGYGAFNGCTGLTDIQVAEGNPVYSSLAGVLLNKAQTELIRFPEGRGGEYCVPEGVTSINYMAFWQCSSLKKVTLPDSVTSIDHNAFVACYTLSYINFPDGLTSIGSQVFSLCSALTSIELPDALMSIGMNAFFECRYLKNVTFNNSEQERLKREGNGWSTEGNEALFQATWRYLDPPKNVVIHNFADLNAAVQAYTGSKITACYSDSEALVIEKTITLPENFFLCADADDSTLRIPAGVTLKVQSTKPGALKVDNLVVEGTMQAYRKAVTYRTLSGTVDWLRVVIKSGECGAQGNNITWTLYDDGQMIVSGSGNMKDYSVNESGMSGWEDEFQTLVIERGVTSIGSSAFEGCYGLKSVSLPAGLTEIHNDAFRGCGALEDLKLPDSLRSLGSYAFYGTGLRRVTVPSQVEKIGDGALNGCLSMEEINVAAENSCYRSVDGVLFNADRTELITYPCAKAGTYVVPNGVKVIWDSAFAQCSNLTGISFPEGLLSIGGWAFSSCKQLSAVSFPDSLLSVEKYSFNSCTALKSIHFPEKIKRIEKYAFSFCTALTEIELPAGLSEIGEYAFSKCSSVTRLSLPASLLSVECYAFNRLSALTDVYFDGSLRERKEREGNNWSATGNEDIFAAEWHYSVETISKDIRTFAELKAAVAAYDGSDTYLHYDGNDEFIFEESITLPEHLFFSADAAGSSVRIPAGVTVTEKSAAKNSFHADKLIIEGTMQAYRNAVSCRTLTGTVIWLIAAGECGAQGDNVTWIIDEDGLMVVSGSGKMMDFSSDDRGWSSQTDKILSLVVEPGVTYIGTNAFAGCDSLKSASLPKGLTELNSECFRGCRALKDVILPDSLRFIGVYAFYGTGLRSVTIPTNVDNIGYGAFSGCLSMAEIKVADGNSSFVAIDNVLFQADLSRLIAFPCTKGGTYVVPNGVEVIWDSAFDRCTKLTGISFPEGLRSIGGWAFLSCNHLTALVFPDSLTSVQMYAFSGCTALKNIIFREGLDEIGTQAFADCTALESAAFKKGPTTIGAGAFNFCSSLKNVYYTGSSQERSEREGKGWSTDRNKPLFNAAWHYGSQIRFGWYEIDGEKYYYGPSTQMVTGLQEIEGKKYYFNDNGVMQTGWQKIDGKWYLFSSAGVMKTGWQQSGGKWYYMKADGVMATGWQKVSGKWYYMNSSGVMQTGFQTIGGKKYYFNSSGAMLTGWQKIDGKWYYMNSSGAVQTGWQKIDGKWYYFNTAGDMATGWKKISGKWYYFESSGSMVTGWKKISGKWYYFEPSGAMLANTSETIGGKTYNFNSSGVCTNP